MSPNILICSSTQQPIAHGKLCHFYGSEDEFYVQYGCEIWVKAMCCTKDAWLLEARRILLAGSPIVTCRLLDYCSMAPQLSFFSSSIGGCCRLTALGAACGFPCGSFGILRRFAERFPKAFRRLTEGARWGGGKNIITG